MKKGVGALVVVLVVALALFLFSGTITGNALFGWWDFEEDLSFIEENLQGAFGDSSGDILIDAYGDVGGNSGEGDCSDYSLNIDMNPIDGQKTLGGECTEEMSDDECSKLVVDKILEAQKKALVTCETIRKSAFGDVSGKISAAAAKCDADPKCASDSKVTDSSTKCKIDSCKIEITTSDKTPRHCTYLYVPGLPFGKVGVDKRCNMFSKGDREISCKAVDGRVNGYCICMDDISGSSGDAP